MSLNYFKYVELIEASSPQLLASKLRAINLAYQLQAVWSDGSKHYALINANRKLSASIQRKLAEIE